MTDEEDFLFENPDARRLLQYDSLTAKAYSTRRYLILFDKDDGSLAWKFDMITYRVIFECEHIKKGREMLKRLLGF